MRTEADRKCLEVTKKDLTLLVQAVRESRMKTENVNVWPIYDSTDKDYDKHFSEFKIRTADIAQKESPVIIDLLSSSSAIRRIYLNTLDENMKGVSVSVEDLRHVNICEIDKRLNITHIVGNLGKPAVWDRIKTLLGDKKADLIIERGYAGVAYLPQDSLYFLYTMNKIWNMLSSKRGIFIGDFTQINIPKSKVYDWSENMQKKGIDIEHTTHSIKIIKHADSPEKLPR